MVGPARPQFVLFGSSIVQFSYDSRGWGATLAYLYGRQADILLRGYTGWNSRLAVEVLEEIFPKDATIQPSLVIVYFGGNDSVEPNPSGFGQHVPLPEYKVKMKTIAKHLRSLSEETRIIFLTTPPINEQQIIETFGNLMGRSNKSCKEYAETLMELCQEIGIKAINLWTAIQQKEDWLTTCFTDGIHLSEEGSKIVVKEILRVIKYADWAPNLNYVHLPLEYSADSPYFPVDADGNPTNPGKEWLEYVSKFQEDL